MTKKLRFDILERDEFTCCYCGVVGEEADLQVDHIHPQSKGGTDDPDNLATACHDCNQGKRARVGVHIQVFSKAESELRRDLIDAARSMDSGAYLATFFVLKCCIIRLAKSDDPREQFLAAELDAIAEAIPGLYPSPPSTEVYEEVPF